MLEVLGSWRPGAADLFCRLACCLGDRHLPRGILRSIKCRDDLHLRAYGQVCRGVHAVGGNMKVVSLVVEPIVYGQNSAVTVDESYPANKPEGCAGPSDNHDLARLAAVRALGGKLDPNQTARPKIGK